MSLDETPLLYCQVCDRLRDQGHFAPNHRHVCDSCAPSLDDIPEPNEHTLVKQAELAAYYSSQRQLESELAARMLARRRLLPFIKRFRSNYTAGWVHEDICRRLERFKKAVENKEAPRMLLMMPVRTGKSEIGSRHFAPWLLGDHPDWEIIAASGGQTLALTFSRYIRDLMRDPLYTSVFPDCKLSPDSQSVENWNTTAGGGYMAAGIGTMIVGRGAHVLLIDDPITSAEAADSAVQRDAVWEWYIANALNRLAPGGGVLGIMCMTGDTPVLMADHTQRRLDTLVLGDAVATFDRGRLATSTVLGIRSNGRDSVLRIKMSSGRIVRANGRHPFLATTNGELKWIRAASLSTANKIVTLRDSGVSGKGLLVLPKGVRNQPYAEGFATRTTQKSDGQTDTAPIVTPPKNAGTPNSSTYTESPSLSTTHCSLHSKESAQCVGSLQAEIAALSTGVSGSPSIIATKQGKSGGCSATNAILPSEVLELSQWHLPQSSTSDFTLDDIVSIEPDGVEEVFDLQIECTENFIANGLVSHNTHWNEDDWAGRIEQLSALDDGGDKFEIVKYPAINELGDEYILPDETIVQFPEGTVPPPGSKLTRVVNTPLHPERYTMEMLMNTRATYYGLGQQRWWSALYQQNPAPEEGVFFTKEMVRYGNFEKRSDYNVYQAWDFAITEKQKSDWTACTTLWQTTEGTYIIAEVRRFRSDDGESIVDRILDAYEEHSPSFVGFEDGQIWKALRSTFTRRCQERKLYPAYDEIVPITDKRARASPLKGLMQSKRVYIQASTTWTVNFVKELLSFEGGGKHDDQVDSCAHAISLALKHSAQRKPAPKKLPSWRDKLPGFARNSAGHMAA